jgi:hypothetical protein
MTARPDHEPDPLGNVVVLVEGIMKSKLMKWAATGLFLAWEAGLRVRGWARRKGWWPR